VPFVLDASITACWAFDDEDHQNAALALERLADDHAVVPALWWYEIRNILLMNERRGRISPRSIAKFLGELHALPVEVDQNHPDEEMVFLTVRKHRLTVYDAVYLELARRGSMSLATLDTDLARAAKNEKIQLIGENG
jgi:predicted nucleic acid-binding protein